MVHQGEGLAFGLEAGDDRLGIHAELDDLERDLAPHGCSLLGEIDHPATTLADLFHEPVRAELVAWPLDGRVFGLLR